MGVQPEPRELLGLAASINLSIEEVRNGHVVERHVDPSAGLRNEPNIFDEQQVVFGRDSKTADLGVARVT
jgi:hypothetical protein